MNELDTKTGQYKKDREKYIQKILKTNGKLAGIIAFLANTLNISRLNL